MKDQNMHAEKVLQTYIEKYGKQPYLPKMQCTGASNPQYIAMIENALKENREVNDSDYDVYFPMKEGVLY